MDYISNLQVRHICQFSSKIHTQSNFLNLLQAKPVLSNLHVFGANVYISNVEKYCSCHHKIESGGIELNNISSLFSACLKEPTLKKLCVSPSFCFYPFSTLPTIIHNFLSSQQDLGSFYGIMEDAKIEDLVKPHCLN